MSDETIEYTIHTDGGARGNPGPAAFAYTIEAPGRPAIEEKGAIGISTNNIAEYTGLVRALEHAQRIGARRLLVHSDSELMIKQMNGEYKVRHAGLLPLYEEADDLRSQFEKVTLRHVRREQNKRADKLCNEALDAALGVTSKPAKPSVPERATVPDGRPDLEIKVRDDAIDCLTASAAAWAHGDAKNPSPALVWEQLWDLLIEANVLKKRK